MKKRLLEFYIRLVMSPLKFVNTLFKSKFLGVGILDEIKKAFSVKLYINGLYFDAQEKKVFDRGYSFKLKEPDTMMWMDNYIKKDDILYDIGANIGVYSLYAAKYREAVVYAFEPESANYYYLNKNIYHNDLSAKVHAFCIALNDINLSSVLNLSVFKPAYSSHNFHEELDINHQSSNPKFKQGMIGISLDNFVYSFGGKIPNHIKIDVDGNEEKVIAGMTKVLQEKDLRTVAIEVNLRLKSTDVIIQEILSKGFVLLNDEKYLNKKYLSIGFQNMFFVREK